MTINRFVNVKIGKKLTLVFGSAAALVISISGLGIWSLHSVEAAVDNAQAETDKMMLGHRYSEDVQRLLMYVANAAVRGRNTADEDTIVEGLRKSYSQEFDQIKTSTSAPEARHLLETWEQQGAATKTAN